MLGAVALYLAQPVKTDGASASTDPRLLSSMLLPGDVLLTDGQHPRRSHRAARHALDVVACRDVVGPLEDGPDPRCIVEADVAAAVRSVRLSELKGLHARVLRPRDLDEGGRRRLAGRIGNEYDLAHAWALGTKLLRRSPYGIEYGKALEVLLTP